MGILDYFARRRLFSFLEKALKDKDSRAISVAIPSLIEAANEYEARGDLTFQKELQNRTLSLPHTYSPRTQDPKTKIEATLFYILTHLEEFGIVNVAIPDEDLFKLFRPLISEERREEYYALLGDESSPEYRRLPFKEFDLPHEPGWECGNFYRMAQHTPDVREADRNFERNERYVLASTAVGCVAITGTLVGLTTLALGVAKLSLLGLTAASLLTVGVVTLGVGAGLAVLAMAAWCYFDKRSQKLDNIRTTQRGMKTKQLRDDYTDSMDGQRYAHEQRAKGFPDRKAWLANFRAKRAEERRLRREESSSSADDSEAGIELALLGRGRRRSSSSNGL